MAVSRDRVAFTTPIARSVLKGMRINANIDFDASTRRFFGSVDLYDASGAFVTSRVFNARINQSKRDALMADILADILAQNPDLAGVLTVEQVNDVNDPVSNP